MRVTLIWQVAGCIAEACHRRRTALADRSLHMYIPRWIPWTKLEQAHLDESPDLL